MFASATSVATMVKCRILTGFIFRPSVSLTGAAVVGQNESVCPRAQVT